MDNFYQQLKNYGKVKLNEPLSKHTTFKIGGKAKFLVIVDDNDKLVSLLNYLSAEGREYFILGGGSNLLMPDEDLDSVVIKLHNTKYTTASKAPPGRGCGGIIHNTNLELEAGVQLGTVVGLASKHSLSGVEWGIGIPGTVGGAVRGNAGAMGEAISNILEKVEIWRDGEILTLSNKECNFGYRHSVFKNNNDVILRVYLKLQSGNKQEIMALMQKNIKQRTCRIPTQPSPGCYFKNIRLEDWSGDNSDFPESFYKYGKVSAGWLIEQAGGKGLKKGDAIVSDIHSNTIINIGNATQADVLNLVEEIKEKVYNRFRVELEEEVEIVMT